MLLFYYKMDIPDIEDLIIVRNEFSKSVNDGTEFNSTKFIKSLKDKYKINCKKLYFLKTINI